MNLFLRPVIQGLCLALVTAVAMPVLAQSQARMVGPEHLSSYWILLNTKVDADIPNSGNNLDKPGCVAVSYMIGSDGKTQDVAVRKVAPQSDLGPVAQGIVSRFQYGQSLTNKNKEPVATYYVVPFNMPADAAEKAKLIAACQLPGYSQG
ncbi:TonB protein C-terminal [Dyella sp. OK004]|uniref:energy transducer TonB n=1 Tax=Dyella sp. OK004 TaxID=1855292 RepID=UPI0008EE2C8B|nr:energy transducer TonB [Dyella sp. OK004]SFS08076.1 TonB protein C-terminal [Dyella sp. OK004]